MNEIRIKVAGITCPACVKLVERRLLKLGGVISVVADLRGWATITSSVEISLNDIKNAFINTDYKVI